MEKEQHEMLAFMKERSDCLSFMVGQIHAGIYLLLHEVPEHEWREKLELMMEKLTSDVNKLFYEPSAQQAPSAKVQP